MGGEDYLHLVSIKADTINHITLKNTKKCRQCSLKDCQYVCPSGVFKWDQPKEMMEVLWQRCVECGACEPACPENIEYTHPRGGYGVTYHT